MSRKMCIRAMVKPKRFSIIFDEHIYDAFKSVCMSEGVFVAGKIRELVEEYLEHTRVMLEISSKK